MNGIEKSIRIPYDRSTMEENYGIRFPKTLVPNSTVDFYKWAVIACDQYTSDPDYWAEVNRIVGDEPSTLRLVFPEVYLGAPDTDSRLDQIARNTGDYLSRGLLTEHEAAPMLIERHTGSGRVRRGLLLAFDLEEYDFGTGSTSLIRPTEETITERLPPRMRIRKAAAAEFPHILILIDDRSRGVIEPVFSGRSRLKKLYETELMLGGGSVTGYLVDKPDLRNSILDGLRVCLQQAAELSPNHPLLFAVGDGNHSLATAKQVWEEKKAAGAAVDDPARYALAELVNLYDEGLVFEPIHRIVTGRSARSLRDDLVQRVGGRIVANGRSSGAGAPVGDSVRWVLPRESGTIELAMEELPGVRVQRALEEMARADSSVAIDYIHGDEALDELVHREQGVGLLFPGLSKGGLFSMVSERGALPRKMFSLGEAGEKRYYVEGRSIQA